MRKILNIKSMEITEGQNLPAAVSAEVLENEKKQDAINELSFIDLSSIRAMREYIASKADAPQIIKDKEAAAVLAREKIK